MLSCRRWISLLVTVVWAAAGRVWVVRLVCACACTDRLTSASARSRGPPNLIVLTGNLLSRLLQEQVLPWRAWLLIASRKTAVGVLGTVNWTVRSVRLQADRAGPLKPDTTYQGNYRHGIRRSIQVIR